MPKQILCGFRAAEDFVILRVFCSSSIVLFNLCRALGVRLTAVSGAAAYTESIDSLNEEARWY